MRVDEDDRSMDSETVEQRQKLGELSDEDLTDDLVGNITEITHDGKVTKEILKIGEGKWLKMGYKAFITYKAYFFKDHLIFDERKEITELCLGDNSWPDGLQTGVEKMRKGEISKIRIKHKHGFGRPLRQDELIFPKGWDDGAKKNRLLCETIIYEVTLHDF
jgi:FKBP-type peptidyl-prolyl cis-trans isomerase